MSKAPDTTAAVKTEFAARRRRDPSSLLDRFTTEAEARRFDKVCRTTISLDRRVLTEAKSVASTMGITVNDLVLAGLDLVFRHQSRPSVTEICKSPPCSPIKLDSACDGPTPDAPETDLDRKPISGDNAVALLPTGVT